MNSPPNFIGNKVNPKKTMMVRKTIEKQYCNVTITHVVYCFLYKRIGFIVFFPMKKCYSLYIIYLYIIHGVKYYNIFIKNYFNKTKVSQK